MLLRLIARTFETFLPVISPQALAGGMAGVQVMQSEGAPGASISVRVRGGISITQSNEPLYIIDGFPSEDGMSTLTRRKLKQSTS